MKYFLPRYSAFTIQKKAQELVVTEAKPNYGQTTIINPILLENHLNALEGVDIGPDSTRRNNYNKFIRYLKELIQKRDNPATQVAMSPPSIKEIWSILAVSDGVSGVEPDVVISILENVKPGFITGDQIQKLKDLKRISP